VAVMEDALLRGSAVSPGYMGSGRCELTLHRCDSMRMESATR